MAGWYYWAGLRYVTTAYAWVDAPVVWVKADSPATVMKVYRGVGDPVMVGQPLFSILSSSRVRPVVAPSRGWLGQVVVTAGERVAPGESLAAVVGLSQLDVLAELPEAEIGRIAVGQSVDLLFDALPGRRFSGTVQEIGAGTLALGAGVPSLGQFSKQVQWIPVRIGFQATGLGLRAGESAWVRIHI